MNCKHTLMIMMLFVLAGCNQFNLQQPTTDLNDLVAAQQRANLAYENEDWQAAERDYRYLIQQLPREAEPWFRLGNIYARTNQLDAAVAAYREALVRDTKSGKAWHNLGIVQLRQASNTFNEMQQYTPSDDPLNQRAQEVLNSMDTLMSGFGAATPE